MTDYARLYIGGKWVEPAGEGRLEVIDSTTEEVFATIPEGVEADVDRAVAAAKNAFATWSTVPPVERSKQLRRVADALEARRDELSDIEAHEIGMPKPLSAVIQVGLGIRAFATAAEVLEGFEFEDSSAGGLVLKEPIGVVGAITPWNYPLNQIGAKVAYALAAGCTVVLKPSEIAPINAFVLAEIFDEIEFAPGAFNLVSGIGPVVGEALARHPDVDMISFTGSTRAGKRVAELAAQSVKRVALELGGKSPNVILDDADLANAVADGVASAYANSGQTCSALTRMKRSPARPPRASRSETLSPRAHASALWSQQRSGSGCGGTSTKDSPRGRCCSPGVLSRPKAWRRGSLCVRRCSPGSLPT
jgi:aldehyde dehydrogenase (NAD+)